MSWQIILKLLTYLASALSGHFTTPPPPPLLLCRNLPASLAHPNSHYPNDSGPVLTCMLTIRPNRDRWSFSGIIWFRSGGMPRMWRLQVSSGPMVSCERGNARSII